MTSTLLETSSVEKIVEIDKHIGCAISGLQADSRTLIEHARYVGKSKGIMIRRLTGAQCYFAITRLQLCRASVC